MTYKAIKAAEPVYKVVEVDSYNGLRKLSERDAECFQYSYESLSEAESAITRYYAESDGNTYFAIIPVYMRP